ncbi:MAG: putative Holliday junction ATP-dependent helicase RuvA [Planctomycetota bacterium]
MISRIEGVLEDVVDGVAEVRVGDGVIYELLVPACDAGELTMRHGTRVSFFTLHYLEGQGQGSHFVPRLIGFSSREQRAFFELLTTVKGIGNRKALRAMQVSHARMAEAIASGDAKFLSTLPEIGKRTAESTIVELKGKLDPFLKDPSATRRALAGSMPAVTVEIAPLSGPAADAEEMMVQLGVQRAQARTAIERVLARSTGKQMTASEIMALAL